MVLENGQRYNPCLVFMYPTKHLQKMQRWTVGGIELNGDFYLADGVEVGVNINGACS